MHEPERSRRRKRRRRKAPGVSLRVRIIAACNQREVTPKEIARQEGLPLATVGYYFRVLEKEGYLHVSRKEKARGFMRHFYVADRKKVITDKEFAQMTPEQRHEASEALLRDFLAHCREALQEGTLDARSDSHLSWSPLLLDRRGWNDLQTALDRMLDRGHEIQSESRDRLRQSGEEPIPTTFALGGFESPAPQPASSSRNSRLSAD
jgi:DNA-binding transcriptional ArsR family regulator